MIANAQQLSGGQSTIVFKTVGPHHLHIAPNGELSTTGEWRVNRDRVKKCSQVQVYVLPQGEHTATVYFGRFHDVRNAPIDPAKDEVVFVQEGVETTNSDW